MHMNVIPCQVSFCLFLIVTTRYRILPGQIRHQSCKGHACKCKLSVAIVVEVALCLAFSVSQSF